MSACNCKRCREDRAAELIDALNKEGCGFVLHSALHVAILAEANSLQKAQEMSVFCPYNTTDAS